MLFKRSFLSFLLLVSIPKLNTIPGQVENYSNEGSKEKIVWSQVCSCRSYYGVPHTCYYSQVTDYDYSCQSKCLREANR